MVTYDKDILRQNEIYSISKMVNEGNWCVSAEACMGTMTSSILISKPTLDHYVVWN